MKIESKYNIGDTVYSAHWEAIQDRAECPDCLATGIWKATTPAGEAVEIQCPTCSHGYDWGSGYIRPYKVVPRVQCLTIGQATYERDYDMGDDAYTFRYMCVETGVGSGSCYYERDLFELRDDALALATFKAREEQDRRDTQQRERRQRELKEAARRSRCPMCNHGIRPDHADILSRAREIVRQVDERKAKKEKVNG